MNYLNNFVNFFQTIWPTFWFQSILRLMLGFLLAGIIGIERSSWNKPAGFRTHALVGLSAVLVMLCGEYMSNQYDIDPSRIPAQLLSGIGFIGAGTILRDGFNVKGLTTAAGLLAVTCIGLSIGTGFYLGGILTTFVAYMVLSYSYKISDRLDHFNILDLEIKISEKESETIKTIEDTLSNFNVDIKKIKRCQPENDDGDNIPSSKSTIKILAQYNKKDINKNKIISSLTALDNIVEILEDN